MLDKIDGTRSKLRTFIIQLRLKAASYLDDQSKPCSLDSRHSHRRTTDEDKDDEDKDDSAIPDVIVTAHSRLIS